MPKRLKITISPGQGLLLLINHYKASDRVLRLKKLYLCGAETIAEQTEIQALLEDPCLSNYTVSYTKQSINNDPTRRYFETHLAYETLKHGLDELSYVDLNHHFGELCSLIDEDHLSEDACCTLGAVLEGKPEDCHHASYREYSHYIEKIKASTLFDRLSPRDREKIELLVQSAFMGVLLTAYITMPINIYHTGVYRAAYKGVLPVQEQHSTRNQHFGLLKGHMPIARDDIARSEVHLPYVRAADKSTFDEMNEGWVALNFNQLMHPFSNSISGTILCQLRSLAHLRNAGDGIFTESGEKMALFCQLLISSLLFCSGGHTLKEYVEPLSLRAVQQEFQKIPGFGIMDLYSLYFVGNEANLERVIQSTIDYNSVLLSRKKMHHEIARSHCATTVDTENMPYGAPTFFNGKKAPRPQTITPFRESTNLLR